MSEVGRPSKYRPEFCKQLIKHMASGKSFESFGSVAEVGRRTLYEWLDDHPEWKEAKEAGEMKAQDFYENRLASLVSGVKVPGFNPKLSNPTLIIFALKTRFHKTWGERKELDEDDDLEFN